MDDSEVSFWLERRGDVHQSNLLIDFDHLEQEISRKHEAEYSPRLWSHSLVMMFHGDSCWIGSLELSILNVLCGFKRSTASVARHRSKAPMWALNNSLKYMENADRQAAFPPTSMVSPWLYRRKSMFSWARSLATREADRKRKFSRKVSVPGNDAIKIPFINLARRYSHWSGKRNVASVSSHHPGSLCVDESDWNALSLPARL